MSEKEKIDLLEATVKSLTQDLEYLKNNLPINQSSKKSPPQNYPSSPQGLSMDDFMKLSGLIATSNAQVARSVSDGIKSGMESRAASSKSMEDLFGGFRDDLMDMLEEEPEGNGSDKKINEVMENVLKGLQTLQNAGYDISGFLSKIGINPAVKVIPPQDPQDADIQD